jgi:hypothetical protein
MGVDAATFLVGAASNNGAHAANGLTAATGRDRDSPGWCAG